MKAHRAWQVTNVHGDSWVQSRRPKNPPAGTTVKRVVVFSGKEERA